MTKILITGGSGLIGTQLSNRLTKEGFEIAHLSRSPRQVSKYKTYKWDLNNGVIDPDALNGVDHIIHLAGAGVADKRWSKERKEVILSSRVDGANLLFDEMKKSGRKLKTFISASGISCYGIDSGAKSMSETEPISDGFLATVVEKWEHAADQFSEISNVVKVRTGVVLTTEGGALPTMAMPVKLYAGAPLGRGTQYVSWIHIGDLVEMYAFILSQNLSGVFNAVAPNPVTNKELTKSIAKSLNKPLFLPPVPEFIMKLILGEMSQVVVGGNNVSAEKIQKHGFSFNFPEINQALSNLYHK